MRCHDPSADGRSSPNALLALCTLTRDNAAACASVHCLQQLSRIRDNTYIAASLEYTCHMYDGSIIIAIFEMRTYQKTVLCPFAVGIVLL